MMTAPHPTTPTPSQPEPASPVLLDRRRLFHGGAALAAVAGAGVLATAVPTTAEAADGDPLALGETNSAGSTTTLRIGGSDGGTAPALSLQNGGGPALELPPLDASWDEPLEVGQIANRTTGPLIGVDHGSGAVNTYVALGTDLQSLPVPYAVAPFRLVDTRSTTQRDNIVAASSNAFGTSLRLRAGQWFDVAVLAADDVVSVSGVWANLTVTGSVAGGYLTVYPADEPRTRTSSVNFGTGQTIANSGFFRPGVSEDTFALRIWSSAETHVIVDVTGLALLQEPGPQLGAAARRRALAARPAVVTPAKLARSLGRR